MEKERNDIHNNKKNLKFSKNLKIECTGKGSGLFNAIDELNLQIDFNRCLFCTKIFMNSQFLIKHMYRRHSEHLISTYRKFYKTLKLERNELDSSKASCNDVETCPKGKENNQLKMQTENPGLFAIENDYITEISKELCNINTAMLKNESALHYLTQKFKEFDLKSSMHVDSQELQNFKDILIVELNKSIEKNNIAHRTCFKKEIDRLIELNSDQINISSQLLLQEVEKKIENKLQLIVENSQRKSKNSKLSRRKQLSDSKVYISSFDQRRSTVSSTLSNVETNNKMGNKIAKEISTCLEEKLCSLNIPAGTLKLSDSEYDTKMRLIQSDRESLNNKLKNFEAIRQQLDYQANSIALQKQKKKNQRKFYKSGELFPIAEENNENGNFEAESGKDQTFSASETHTSSYIDKNFSSHSQWLKTYFVKTDNDSKTSFSKHFGSSLTSEKNSSSNNETKAISVKKCEHKVSDSNVMGSNSAASLKLIDCSNALRNLQNFSPSAIQELSPSNSFDSNDDLEELLIDVNTIV